MRVRSLNSTRKLNEHERVKKQIDAKVEKVLRKLEPLNVQDG